MENPNICPDCGYVVPEKLPENSPIWHPAIPTSEGTYMAAIEGVGVIGLVPCTDVLKLRAVKDAAVAVLEYEKQTEAGGHPWAALAEAIDGLRVGT